jgi:NAD-dependent deacetylase sirtuin 2
VAGLEPQDLVEAHGTFYTSHCVNTSCRKEYTMGWMKGEAGLCGQAGLGQARGR